MENIGNTDDASATIGNAASIETILRVATIDCHIFVIEQRGRKDLQICRAAAFLPGLLPTIQRFRVADLVPARRRRDRYVAWLRPNPFRRKQHVKSMFGEVKSAEAILQRKLPPKRSPQSQDLRKLLSAGTGIKRR